MKLTPEEMATRRLAGHKLNALDHALRDAKRYVYGGSARSYHLAMLVMDRIDGELAEIRILVSKLQDLRPESEHPT